MCFRASRAFGGVGRSGCPMFRWYTFTPRALAASEKGVSFLIGDAGILVPRSDIPGMVLFCFSLVGYRVLLALEFFRVGKVVVIYEIEIVVELEDIRGCSGDVQADNVCIRDSLKVLDDAT